MIEITQGEFLLDNALLTLQTPILQNGQAYSNNLFPNCWRIVWVFDNFVGLALKVVYIHVAALI